MCHPNQQKKGAVIYQYPVGILSIPTGSLPVHLPQTLENEGHYGSSVDEVDVGGADAAAGDEL